jgi:hypothetical protein
MAEHFMSGDKALLIARELGMGAEHGVEPVTEDDLFDPCTWTVTAICSDGGQAVFEIAQDKPRHPNSAASYISYCIAKMGGTHGYALSSDGVTLLIGPSAELVKDTESHWKRSAQGGQIDG